MSKIKLVIDHFKSTFLNFPPRLLPVSCPGPSLPAATCYWSNLYLTSVWRLMDSSPTTPASHVVLRYQLSTQEPVRGPSPINLQSNLLPPPHQPPLPSLCPQRDPNQSSLREAVDRAPQARTGGWSSQGQMERDLVGEVMCTLSLCVDVQKVYI